ncbi:hypothetical protein BaRGS_00013016 [Batillaria attramentaria]|uniref:Transposase n=1 Tax=Batillaria attramentaria TaxID=370345 RepID=A0ABD0L911_9CAEN
MVRAGSSKRKKGQSSDSSQDFCTDRSVLLCVSSDKKKKCVRRDGSKAKENKQLRTGAASIRAHFAVVDKNTESTTMDRSVSDQSSQNPQVSAADLMEKMCHLSGQLSQLNKSVEEMRGEIFCLRKENDELKKDLEHFRKREEKLREIVFEAKQQAAVAERRSNDLEQYTRRNNIRIYGMSETDQESAVDCEKKVLRMFKDKLGLADIKPEHIEACHRVGQKGKPRQRATQQQSDQDRPRSVIVRFVSRKTAEAVLYHKKKLKNTAYVVVEDLTSANFYRLRKCKEHPDITSAWTRRGSVFVKTSNNKIVQIDTLEDLDTLSVSSPATSTPHSGRRLRGFGRGRGSLLNSRSDDRRPGHSADDDTSNMELGAVGGVNL